MLCRASVNPKFDPDFNPRFLPLFILQLCTRHVCPKLTLVGFGYYLVASTIVEYLLLRLVNWVLSSKLMKNPNLGLTTNHFLFLKKFILH